MLGFACIIEDTNIILDIALKREPFFRDSARIFTKIDEQIIEGYITASSVTDIYYIASKQKGKVQSKKFINDLIQIVDVIGVDKEVIIQALESELKDFEDAVQALAAEHCDVETIATRNVEDFRNCKLKVLHPNELLVSIEK
jgi:predicted nucleic acid-binding protein